MNERIPDSPPTVLPVSADVQRPLWSVMIPSYNCAKYITKTLESVLMQDPGKEKMQIEVVDDCSTDEVEKIVNETGKGRVSFYRQPYNRGSLRNFETCLNRSCGKYIHLLHGDDFIDPGFYTEVEKLFDAYPDAGAACTGFWHVGENNELLYPDQSLADKPVILDNWLTILAQGQKLQPPGVVVKRSVYEHLGGFFGIHYGEDWVMWMRIAKYYPVAYTPLRLAKYRIHDDHNITTRSFKSGQHIKDIEQAINIIQDYLPAEQKKKLKKIARKNWSLYFAKTSDMVYHSYNNPKQALQQSKMAFKLNANFTTFFFMIKMYVKKLIRYKMSEADSRNA
jgi:glycosyltransferase involved in cell wall biosynthesis